MIPASVKNAFQHIVAIISHLALMNLRTDETMKVCCGNSRMKMFRFISIEKTGTS